MSHVGDLIRDRREELGIDQTTFAEQAGIPSQSYLSQIERGNRGWPRKYIAAIAEGLGMTEAELRAARKRDIQEARRARIVPEDALSTALAVSTLEDVRDDLTSIPPPDRTRRVSDILGRVEQRIERLRAGRDSVRVERTQQGTTLHVLGAHESDPDDGG